MINESFGNVFDEGELKCWGNILKRESFTELFVVGDVDRRIAKLQTMNEFEFLDKLQFYSVGMSCKEAKSRGYH